MVNFLLCDTCLLCTSAVVWVGGVDVYTMWAVHCLSALVSWAHLCVSFMLMTTGSSIRAVICRCVARICFRLCIVYHSVVLYIFYVNILYSITLTD